MFNNLILLLLKGLYWWLIRNHDTKDEEQRAVNKKQETEVQAYNTGVKTEGRSMKAITKPSYLNHYVLKQ